MVWKLLTGFGRAGRSLGSGYGAASRARQRVVAGAQSVSGKPGRRRVGVYSERETPAQSLLVDGPALGWQSNFQEVVQFYGYIRIRVVLTVPDDASISEVCTASDSRVLAGLFAVDATEANSLQLTIEVLADDSRAFDEMRIFIVAQLDHDRRAILEFATVEAATLQYEVRERANPCTGEFFRRMNEHLEGRVLEIGSRARSGISRRQMFGERPYIGVDVLPGEGVTVVGDVHALTAIVERQSIDFVFSASVFEHLIMPWKVVLEMNEVMRPGGIALIVTHQTCGMHDVPWDFWRFSDACWHGLFNRWTGFEILSTDVSFPTYIVPFLRLASFAGFEGAAGFYQSAVLARKIGEVDHCVRWDVESTDVVGTPYPQ
jgi:Methyltransferase domain